MIYKLLLLALATKMRPARTKKANLLLATVVSLSTLLLLLFLATQKLPIRTLAASRYCVRVLLSNANANAEDAAAVDRHCDGMLHRDVCVLTLSTIPNLAQKPLNEVISDVVARAATTVRASTANCTSYLRRPHRLCLRDRLAVADCIELFGYTLDQLHTAADKLSAGNASAGDFDAGVQTILSAAMTNQYTCLDGLAGPSASYDDPVHPYIRGRIYHVAHLVSNSLAMLRCLPQRRRGLREAFDGYGRMRRPFPSWVSAADRRRLQTAAPGGIAADAVVAKDGSGNFTSVSDAVAAAPSNSKTRYVIYIKAGGYFENVEVRKDKTNIMFVGDGMWKTIIRASRSGADNFTTFQSATLGFLAPDITVEDAAGPSKHQAVALRVNADLSAFYRCSFAGYQDTLYAHSLRQFYRECDIYGTVDFVFGDAAVVLQKCNL